MATLKKESELRSELQGKIIAYNHVFNAENRFLPTVMEELALFCRAETSCFHADPRIHAALEGRREVWLLIQSYLNKSVDELLESRKLKQI